MSAMVDTNILVYATRKSAPQKTDARVAMIQASKALMLSTAQFLMSSVVLSEILPMVKRDAAALARVMGVQVAALSGEHVQLACDLADRLGESKKLCRQCLNPKGTIECPGCGNQVSQQYRINDLYVAAAADCVADVDVLYTFDTWLLDDVAPLLTRCTIKRPPGATPGTLFAQVEAAELAEVTRLPTKDKS